MIAVVHPFERKIWFGEMYKMWKFIYFIIDFFPMGALYVAWSTYVVAQRGFSLKMSCTP